MTYHKAVYKGVHCPECAERTLWVLPARATDWTCKACRRVTIPDDVMPLGSDVLKARSAPLIRRTT